MTQLGPSTFILASLLQLAIFTSQWCLGLFAPLCSLLSKAGNIDVWREADLCLLVCCNMRESLVMPAGWASGAAVDIAGRPCCTGGDFVQAADTDAAWCWLRCLDTVCIG